MMVEIKVYCGVHSYCIESTVVDWQIYTAYQSMVYLGLVLLKKIQKGAKSREMDSWHYDFDLAELLPFTFYNKALKIEEAFKIWLVHGI